MSSSFRVGANTFKDAAHEVEKASDILRNASNNFVGNTSNTITHAANTFNQASNSLKHTANTFGDALDDLPRNATNSVAGIGTASNAVHDIESALHNVRGSVQGRFHADVDNALREIESTTIPAVQGAMHSIKSASEGTVMTQSYY